MSMSLRKPPGCRGSAPIRGPSIWRCRNSSAAPGRGSCSRSPVRGCGTVTSPPCDATFPRRPGGRCPVLLVDTSAWIEVFRNPPRLTFDDIGGLDEVVTCLPVVQEVLRGFRDEAAFRVAREAMLALPCVESPLPQERFEEAADLYRAARRAGF